MRKKITLTLMLLAIGLTTACGTSQKDELQVVRQKYEVAEQELEAAKEKYELAEQEVEAVEQRFENGEISHEEFFAAHKQFFDGPHREYFEAHEAFFDGPFRKYFDLLDDR